LTTPERQGRGAAVLAIAKEVQARNKAQGLNDVAAGLSFWAILSVFPAVLAFTSLLGSMELLVGKSAADELRQDITDFLNRTLPPDSEITTTITNIIQQSRASLAIVGLLTAGWGMSKGFAGLCRGLALVDGHPGARYGIKGRLLGLVLGLATLTIMTVVLLQIIVGPLLGFEKLLPGTSTLLSVWEVVRWPVLAVLVVVWLTTLLHIGPGPNSDMRWRDRLPGALFTAAAWVAVTFGFKLYVAIAGGANPVLGVLGAAIVSLTWLYLLAVTTLVGAELNAVLADRRTAAATAPVPVVTHPAPAPGAVGAGVLAAAFLFGRRRR
jgi:membrane protein